MLKKENILVDKRGSRTFEIIQKEYESEGEIRFTCTYQKTKKKLLIYGIQLSSQKYKLLRQEEKKGGLKCIKHPNYLNTVGDPFICNYPYGSSDGFRYYFVVYQKENKTLASVIQTISQQQIIYIMIQLCQALEELHKVKNRFHGYLQPQNIYLVLPQDLSYKWIVKIEQPIPESLIQENRLILSKRIQYYAPQYFQKKQSIKADVWNLGLIYYELVMKKRLTQYEIIGSIPARSKAFPNSFDFNKDQNAQLLKKMLNKEADERIKFSQLLDKLKTLEPQHFQLDLVENQIQIYKNSNDIIFKTDENEVEYEQRRVLLKGFVMSLKYYKKQEVLQISLLLKQNLNDFLRISYEYGQLPEKCKQVWKTLKQFFEYLSEQTKDSLSFLTNGKLKILKKQTAKLYKMVQFV